VWGRAIGRLSAGADRRMTAPPESGKRAKLAEAAIDPFLSQREWTASIDRYSDHADDPFATARRTRQRGHAGA
jgi:hypothetical protein